MGFFNKSDKQDSSSTISVIAKDTIIKGDIQSDCHLFIEGKVQGDIDAKHSITIGKGGKVSGKINAQKLVVQGHFIGEVNSQVINILSGGQINGSVFTPEFVIENGGIFEGQSQMHLKDLLNQES
ncbi:MAG: polymer-forming cytoskeletal protein [Helicobacter sp.]|nr:polymer-forming cytoskeletal protein [Helicobacter sp.]